MNRKHAWFESNSFFQSTNEKSILIKQFDDKSTSKCQYCRKKKHRNQQLCSYDWFLFTENRQRA